MNKINEQITFAKSLSLQKIFIFVQLRALVCKNQTNSKFRGKGEKFDFFLISILDRLDYN